jgi:lipoprotein-anchoring transpeptidase ErfK/SrfK
VRHASRDEPVRRRRALALVCGAAALALLGAVLLAQSSSSTERRVGLPGPPDPALRVGAPRALEDERNVSVWTTVRHLVTARSAPNARAAAVAKLSRKTPEGTPNPLQVLGRARDAGGGVWVRARLAVLPNGTTGWVPRRAISGYRAVRTRLVIDLDRKRATLLRDGRALLRAPIGVGLPQSPTPRGNFYVRNKLVRYRSGFYGPLAYGTSARSPVLTDWPGGGFVGIHGTNRPDLIPGRVSHGCIRMRNPDIERLGRLMPVGTPIRIV